MVPVWVLCIIRHLVFRGPKRDQILTTTQILNLKLRPVQSVAWDPKLLPAFMPTVFEQEHLPGKPRVLQEALAGIKVFLPPQMTETAATSGRGLSIKAGEGVGQSLAIHGPQSACALALSVRSG